MYHTHWELDETPFGTGIDPRFFYQSPTHEEALARLHFLVDQRRRLGILLGEHGSGKSLLLEVFAEEVRRRGLPVAQVNLLGIEPAEFFALVAAQFQVTVERDLPAYALWRTVTDRLAEYRYLQLRATILLDDADRASPEVLTQIARLVQFEPGPQSHLTIVLAAQPRHIGQIDTGLLERVELRIDLGPWDAADTENFLTTALARAGRKSPLFAPPAVARLHELGGGIPRRICQLADLALLAGAGRHLTEIDVETVESVYHELGVLEV